MARSRFSQWYTKPRWRERRARQLRNEPLCRFCVKQGRVVAADVADHVEPHKGDEGKFWYGELQSLCHHCHSSIKQKMEQGKVVTIIGADGWPIRIEE